VVLVALVACGHARPRAATPPAKVEQLNQTGELVELDSHLVSGYVTVVDFWAAHCTACVTFGAQLEQGVAPQHHVVIRKIDVGDGDTPVAKAFEISALPHYRIYDRRKRLRYDLVGSDCASASTLARALAAED
jgi:thiol-disulfide isomerase/thioredoxin